MTVGILIPAYDPDQRLLALLAELVATKRFLHIVVVDDGSHAACQSIFAQAKRSFGHQVTFLRHQTNQGKGAALKTGFAYYQALKPPVQGIATLDADGQHTVKDLCACVDRFLQAPAKMVLGVRRFDRSTPLRSRFGNTLTEQLVRLLTGLSVSDTQTGLRVIPLAYAQAALHLAGDHYQFEFNMLLAAKQHHIQISEQPIATIYLDQNATSHFRVLRDSLSIYAQFFRFAFSGFLSFLVDISLFTGLVSLLQGHAAAAVMIATILARLGSAGINYALNRRVVFQRGQRHAMWRYAALFVVQLLSVVKMAWDLVLFVISYQVQKRFVFRGSAHVN